MNFKGTWHIFEMEVWDEDYFNCEVQAYIKIDSNDFGHFQFGLVSCDIDGDYTGDERFEFTFEGNAELDMVSGSGWLKMINYDLLEGEFRFHLGDDSMFRAKRAK
jgi:hypothetical protein